MLPLFSYLIKSTICISILYLVFRWTLKKENLISLNRIVLISILILSLTIPVIRIPNLFQPKITVAVFPENEQTVLPEMDDVVMRITTLPVESESITTEKNISLEQFSALIYVAGFAVLLMVLVLGLAKLLLLLFRTKIYRRNNYNLALVKHQISPMSFGRYIIISKSDYRNHKSEIISHELAHIKYKHSYDLVLVEIIKLFHWFNPLMYQLRNDLKAIQEYQVDRHLLKSGINSKEYQLLLIKKCVGNERYALANSFNHCQIKNRITMMNNQKNPKGKAWKVAIFLPVALLMLMAFGNKMEDVPIDQSVSEISNNAQQETKSWKESDFKTVSEEGQSSRKEEDFFNAIDSYEILMNRSSQILMRNEKTELNEVSSKMQEIFTKELKRVDVDKHSETKSMLYFKVFCRKDQSTNQGDFDKMLTEVANSFIDARDKLANQKFSKDYNNLDERSKKIIETMVPINIWIVTPKHNAGKELPPPPPPPYPVEIRKDGIYMGKLISIDELKKKVDAANIDGEQLRLMLKIELGVPQSKVDEVKAALKNASIVRTAEFQLKPSPPPPPHVNAVEIEVKDDGIYLANKKVSLEELKTSLSKIKDKNPNQVVKMSLVGGSEQTVNDVKNVLREIGIPHVNYTSSNNTNNFKIINIEILGDKLKLNTYPVELDQIIDRISKLSKGFEGANVTVILSKESSETLTDQVKSVLNKAKETLKINVYAWDQLWIFDDK